MNRLSFLKTLGVGVAAAVITPKILASLPAKEWEKQLEKDLEKDSKNEYGHLEEDYTRCTVESLRIHDMCVDRDGRQWICTGMMLDKIELTAILREPEPNYIDVKRSSFDEYFVIYGFLYAW